MSNELPRGERKSRIVRFVLFGIGIAIGFVPVAMEAAWGYINYSAGPLGNTLSEGGCIVFVMMLGAGSICMTSSRTRPLGYGLLTMVCVGPIISVIACTSIHAARF